MTDSVTIEVIIMTQAIIREIEEKHLKNVPEFRSGDTVIVQVRVKEGSRERLQAFEGVVIARRNRGLNSSFVVRKISHGEGVERTFQLHSPVIDKIVVKRRGDVRKAKLYHLRELSGRAARIKEKLGSAKFEDSVLALQPEKVLEEKSDDSSKTEQSE